MEKINSDSDKIANEHLLSNKGIRVDDCRIITKRIISLDIKSNSLENNIKPKKSFKYKNRLIRLSIILTSILLVVISGVILAYLKVNDYSVNFLIGLFIGQLCIMACIAVD